MALQIEFDDNEYRFNHGAKPRGMGSWAFFFPGETEAWWVNVEGKAVATTFSEAKKHARVEAQKRFSGTNAYVVIRVAT